MKLPWHAQKNDYLKMAPRSADQLSVWVQSYVLTSVKEVKFCYSLTHAISENTLRNEIMYFVFPIHSKSTGKFLKGKEASLSYLCSKINGQPRKSLQGLNCMFYTGLNTRQPSVSFRGRTKSKQMNWICPYCLVTVPKFHNHSFKFHAPPLNLQNSLHSCWGFNSKTEMSKSEDLEIFMSNQVNAIGSHLEYVRSEQNYATSASLKWNTPLVKQHEWIMRFKTMGSGIASSIGSFVT